MALKDTYSEISEKKTSKLGYLILIALFVFIVVIGQTIFSDIQDIPEKPEAPAYCVYDYINYGLEGLTYEPYCYFGNVDYQFGIDVLLDEIAPTVEKIISYNSDIQTKKWSLNDFDRDALIQDYDASLLEEIADTEGVFNQEDLGNDIKATDAKIAAIEHEIEDLEKARDALIAEIQPQIDELEALHNEAQDYYETKNAWYSFKVFILKLFFVLPFFGLFLWLYLKHKRQDSPYTIIITSVFFASTALFLEVVIIFLYDVLPRQWFLNIFEFLMAVAALKYVVYYGSVALVILLLGGIVFFIQKNLYNPHRVALRALKENKCPNCALTLELSEKYCAKCGHQIKTTCAKCNQLKYVDLEHCPYCGE